MQAPIHDNELCNSICAKEPPLETALINMWWKVPFRKRLSFEDKSRYFFLRLRNYFSASNTQIICEVYGSHDGTVDQNKSVYTNILGVDDHIDHFLGTGGMRLLLRSVTRNENHQEELSSR